MSLLKEVLSNYNLYTHYEDEEDDELLGDEEQGFGDEGFGEDEFSDDQQDDGEPSDDQELDQVASKATQKPDRQGLIRAVKGAHLVYKRETEDGTYEELWVFNSPDTIAGNLDIRKAILAGTDIPTNKTNSPDGKQQYVLWTAGNAELLNITGLPN